MLKAIETVYKGYRFRSRLEARWAVFFDALGIEWEYEKEGYDLDGVRYLPDFWLPKQEAWFEVKPKKPTEDELQKAYHLALASHYRVAFGLTIPVVDYLTPGEPGSIKMPFPTLWMVTPYLFSDEGEPEEWRVILDDGGVLWTKCPICSMYDIALWGSNDCMKCKCIPFDKAMSKKYEHPRHNYMHADILSAFDKARQARFEHGESPETSLRLAVRNYVINDGGMCCRFCREWCEDGHGQPNPRDKHAPDCPVLLLR